MSSWTLKDKIDEAANKAATPAAATARDAMMLELNKLVLQRCYYCNGYGHAAKHCPTGVKLEQLKGGVRELGVVLRACLKTSQVKCKMGLVKDYSTLRNKAPPGHNGEYQFPPRPGSTAVSQQ